MPPKTFRPASFNGRHNAVKSKVLLFFCQHQDNAYSARHLARVLGLSEGSLRVLLGRWYEWRYVERRKAPYGVEYMYHVHQHGKEWLERWFPYMPVERYLKEIRDYQAKRAKLVKRQE